MTTFDDAATAVRPVDLDGAGAEAAARSDRLTKPRGSLGRLEDLGSRLAAIARACPPPVPERATVCLFAGDHGVLAQGVSPWPREVTAQMVANICAGGAAVSVLARQLGADIVVTDVGVATPIPPAPVTDVQLRSRAIAPGTADLSQGPAMTPEQTRAALDIGAQTAQQAVADGAQLLITGEMGIGNTTPAAALIAAFTGLPAAGVTGRGTGIDDTTLARKTELVTRAVAQLSPDATPVEILGAVGGFEIAALAGLIVGGASAGVPVLLDGAIAASAALVACAAVPAARGYLIAGHRSVEPGSTAALRHLDLPPLLDLDMRLGEGTGAVLALPLVRAAAHILREMATFDDAAVTDL